MNLSGVLFFPVTPFGDDGSVADDVMRTRLVAGLECGAGGVFAACGTGEFHALDEDEHGLVVRSAVEVVAGRVPVFAGVGGPLPFARRIAARAEAEGADGLLVLPPYLVRGTQAGLVAYVHELLDATSLPVILYHRDNAQFTPATATELSRHPQVVGLKDGAGDVDVMHRIVRAVRAEQGPQEFQFFNGLPTAELYAPAYRGIGVALYSSAVFAFAPEIAMAFYDALEAGDTDTVEGLVDVFYAPFVRLRHRREGYAISLIKAGLRLRGVPVGSVRPPLSDPSADDLDRLRAITEAGLERVGAPRWALDQPVVRAVS
ncbi:MAG: 5-dehydro-4-deoxyglucarate dehydratase [Propionibacterium sp.]|nr:5-dehydro-4-deoxyglucarate dehydratase [Propionibacterium sp.]